MKYQNNGLTPSTVSKPASGSFLVILTKLAKSTDSRVDPLNRIRNADSPDPFACYDRVPGRRGFTLVEIVTVITIITILSSLLAASVISIQRKAKRLESEALFGKLILSFSQYRKDHGAYPDLSGTLKGGDVVISLNNADQWQRFAEIMTLSRPDGSAFENPENQSLIKQFNPKLVRYFDLQLKELEPVSGGHRLVDGFGNPHIYVVVDADLDGKIDEASLPESESKSLRQRIVVYTTDEGNDGYPRLKSWDS